MPWNVSGRNSRAGSVFGAGGLAPSSVIGLPSSVLRGPATLPLLPNYMSTPISGPSHFRDNIALNSEEIITDDARTYPDNFDGKDNLDLSPGDRQDMAFLGGEHNDKSFAPG